VRGPHAGSAGVKGKTMDVMHERVAGLDVHKQTIIACVRIMVGRKAHRQCRTFDTTTFCLVALLTSPFCSVAL
jgi:hypothetical protein